MSSSLGIMSLLRPSTACWTVGSIVRRTRTRTSLTRPSSRFATDATTTPGSGSGPEKIGFVSGGASPSSSETQGNVLPEIDIPKAYDAAMFEPPWLDRWMVDRGGDKDGRKGAPVFRMILPPPNVTGKLHLGHFLTISIQDIIARWKSMSGFQVEWIPGFDHAGIATHSLAMRKMEKEGVSLSVEEVREKVQNIAVSNMNTVTEQMKAFGPILNWESTYYTLDENHSEVVQEAFIELFERGIIQRGQGIINWSCSLQSTVSDVETDKVDFGGRITMRVPKHEYPIEFGVLYHCSYKLLDSEEKLIVATSRPETIFADVALAVNPADSRYARYIGKTAINPLTQAPLPVIADPRVKVDFGTGIVKVTPAHDKLDFAIGASHGLPRIEIISNDGYINEHGGELMGTPRFNARRIVLKILDSLQQLEGTKEYSGVVSLCNRTGDVIELKVLPHWFLKTEKLTNEFLDAVKTGSFVIAPTHHSVTLTNVLKDVQDWCLSRQISWGHKIPVYHHFKFPDVWVSAVEKSVAMKKLQDLHNLEMVEDSEILQDCDVLDTWFSSSLIPVALSGWPDCKDLKPISLMETGHDILFYWVWRMAISTLALMDKLPFHHVLLHGIITDKYGRKMSKSKGNVVDPVHIINGISNKSLIEESKLAYKSGELEEKEYQLRIASLKTDYPEGFQAFGRDPLRLAILSQNILVDQVKLDLQYLENCRHFLNKIWQALRFFFIHREKIQEDLSNQEITTMDITSLPDLWLLDCLHQFADNAVKHLDSANFHLYVEAVRKFFHLQLCDVYLEIIKHDLRMEKDVKQHLIVLQHAFVVGLKLSHPLIPFATQEIWSRLNQKGLLLDEKFPDPNKLQIFSNPKLQAVMQNIAQVAKEIRSLKVRLGVVPKTLPPIFVDVAESVMCDIRSYSSVVESLAPCELKCEVPNPEDRSNLITVILQLSGHICRISIPKSQATARYVQSELSRLQKLQLKLTKLKLQYENEHFQQYATYESKEKLRNKLEKLETQIKEVMSTGLKEEKSPEA